MDKRWFTLGIVIIALYTFLFTLIIFEKQEEAYVPKESEIVQIYKNNLDAIYRFHDDEKNVTCWLFSKGISCLPDSQLRY